MLLYTVVTNKYIPSKLQIYSYGNFGFKKNQHMCEWNLKFIFIKDYNILYCRNNNFFLNVFINVHFIFAVVSIYKSIFNNL